MGRVHKQILTDGLKSKALVTFLLPDGLAGLSTWKKPPSKTTVSVGWGSAGLFPTSIAAFSACCLAFMAAFTAARRDLAATLVPVGLAGAADGFCQKHRTGTLSLPPHHDTFCP